jgi:hypothetical protein
MMTVGAVQATDFPEVVSKEPLDALQEYVSGSPSGSVAETLRFTLSRLSTVVAEGVIEGVVGGWFGSVGFLPHPQNTVTRNRRLQKNTLLPALLALARTILFLSNMTSSFKRVFERLLAFVSTCPLSHIRVVHGWSVWWKPRANLVFLTPPRPEFEPPAPNAAEATVSGKLTT